MTGPTDRSRDAVTPGVLGDRERRAVETLFGVGTAQVVRDHVISHALAAIASIGTDDVLFFGGTALARTHLSTLRLSEDIDLIALRDRADLAERIEGALARRLRRAFGAVHFAPHLREARHPEPTVVQVGDARVQIQLLAAEGYPAWPTEIVDLHQRYSDAPPARMRVLTAPAFVAAKLSAWNDRHAPRDLYDLWALGEAGLIDSDALRLFGRFGSYTSAAKTTFEPLPSDREWSLALEHQGVVRLGPQAAAGAVRQAIESALPS